MGKIIDTIFLISGIIIITILFLGIIFELVVLGYSFIFADTIKCNWLWCEFSSQKGISFIQQTINQTCYMNNNLINCSKIPNFPNIP